VSKLIIYCLKLFAFCGLIGLLFYLFPNNKVFSADWQKYSNNPILTEGTALWDSYYVRSPNVNKINNIYRMWYEGDGGNGGYQSDNGIGYTFSENGVSGWNRSNQSAISPGSADNWENATPEPFVQFDSNLGVYKMWYTSLNSNNWTSGLDRFRTRYATSTDGISWTKYDWVLTGTPNSWDEGGTARGRSIIYRDGLYHMWYAGTNSSSLGSNSYWRIGYATSTNGLIWHKENNGNPVIEPTTTWEFNNSNYPTSDFPTVIYSGGIYHMWYGVGIGDDIKQIAYAYSKDGILWIKPADQNPVLTRTPGSFDEANIAPSTVLLEDNVLKMWYSGYKVYVPGVEGHWRIGYATANASTLPTPDLETIPTAAPLPTPTSTPTPTPTLTPTATSTPTPTPPTKTVIVIPGMTASWNADTLVNCKLNNYKGDWTLIDQARQIYDPLIQALRNNGWIPKVYTYDWRKRIPDNESDLKTYIDSQVTTGGKLNIIGHSMGGLLARSYLETEQDNNKVDKLMTVGSPHKGSVVSYQTWSAGIIPDNDPAWNFMLTLLEKRCAIKTHNDRIAVQQYFPAVRNLLPIFDYLINNLTNNSIPVTQMDATNDWLTSSSFTPPFWNITLGTLSGTGQSTDLSYRVDARNKQDERLGNWTDGKPVNTITTTEGDGTVLISSSELDGADNRIISANHTTLISSQDGITNILTFLGSTQPTLPAQSSTIPSSGLYVIGYPADFWIMDPKGKITKDTDGLISFTNPKRGSYKLFITPKQQDSLIIIVQVLPDGNVLYKEYNENNRFPKIHTLTFNDREPTEDILQ
jgi:pimeloyl-ACP methyl ester carboxylesterase